jgi:serine/threonine-protein kinase
MSSTPSAIGDVIDERYQLLRLIGEGAMGTVYEAAHTNNGRRVALKLIQQVALSDSDVFTRFEREARVAGAIDSRHVASVLDSGRDKRTGLPYIALELLRGEDLGSTLERCGRLPSSVALRIVTQACTGLARAHAASVVHRDIKPANIFLARDEDGGSVTVKLLDFGIAKFRPMGGPAINLTQTGKLLGTPRYMSPEQAQGERDIDTRTDIWSLGSVLYEALTGRPPHNEPEHIGKLILSICSATPPLPSSLVSELSPAIDRTVMRSIATARENRYPNADEFLAELVALTPEGSDILPEDVGFGPSAGGTLRRSRTSIVNRESVTARISQPDAKVVLGPAMEEAGIASTMFATNSTLHPQQARRRTRRWGLGLGAGLLCAAAGTSLVLLSRKEPAPPAASPLVAREEEAPAPTAPTPPVTSAASAQQPTAVPAVTASPSSTGSASAAANVASPTKSGTRPAASAAPRAPSLTSPRATATDIPEHEKTFQ